MSHNLFELNSFPDKLTLSLPLNINSLLPKKELKFFQSEKFVDSMQLALLSVVIGFLLYLAERFLGSNDLLKVKSIFVICSMFMLWHIFSHYLAFRKEKGQNLPSKHLAKNIDWHLEPILSITSDELRILSNSRCKERVICFDNIDEIVYNIEKDDSGISILYKPNASERFEENIIPDSLDGNGLSEFVLLKSTLDSYVLNDNSDNHYQIHRMQVALLLTHILYNRTEQLDIDWQGH